MQLGVIHLAVVSPQQAHGGLPNLFAKMSNIAFPAWFVPAFFGTFVAAVSIIAVFALWNTSPDFRCRCLARRVTVLVCRCSPRPRRRGGGRSGRFLGSRRQLIIVASRLALRRAGLSAACFVFLGSFALLAARVALQLSSSASHTSLFFFERQTGREITPTGVRSSVGNDPCTGRGGYGNNTE